MSFEIRDLTNLVGKKVKNHHGETLGKIDDVVIDHDRQLAEYLILSCPDLFGDGCRYFAIPAQPLLINIGRNNNITIPVEKDALKVATGIHVDECPKFDPEFSHSIFELLYYTKSTPEEREQKDAPLKLAK